MRVSKNKIIGGIYVVVGVVIIIVAFHIPSGFGSGSAVTATSTAKSSVATTSVVATSSALTPVALCTATGVRKSFSIDPRDTNLSWELSNTAPATVIQKSKQEIRTMLSELHKGKYPDYDIYLQLGQEYEILNNGKQAYENYRTAAALEPNKGVAMSDIGSLMAHLGALHTARNAYAQSVARQPSVSLFWVLYLKFLAQYEPRAAKTPAVFTSARKVTNDNTNVLITEAQWLASIGHNSAAISDWEIVRTRVPSEQQRAIDGRIAKLKGI